MSLGQNKQLLLHAVAAGMPLSNTLPVPSTAVRSGPLPLPATAPASFFRILWLYLEHFGHLMTPRFPFRFYLLGLLTQVTTSVLALQWKHNVRFLYLILRNRLPMSPRMSWLTTWFPPTPVFAATFSRGTGEAVRRRRFRRR